MAQERFLTAEINKSYPINQAIRQYTNSVEFSSRVKSRHSIKAYASDLDLFGEFCQTRGIRFLEQLHPQDVNDYLVEMKKKGLKTATLIRKKSSLSGFLKWAKKEDMLKEDYSRQLPKLERPTKTFPTLNNEQIESLIDEAKRQRLKDLVLIILALGTGAKAEEIVRIKVEDIIPSEGKQVSIKFTRSKKIGRQIVCANCNVTLNQEASAFITRYLEAEELKPGQFLFAGRKPKEYLTRQAFWQMLQNYKEKIKVEDLNPKVLRNTFIANFSGTTQELAETLGVSIQTAAGLKRHRP